jgi:antirestriction protein ArdC
MITTNKKQLNVKSKEDKQAEINSILKSLEDGVRDVFDSDKYKRYLEFCGKFHHYSFNNIMLILMQCPHAQKCASYTTWKSLKMQVRKGEKGIKILCPVPYSYTKKEKSTEEDGEESSYFLVSGVKFRIGHVFDISQVDGDIPTLANELTENPEHLQSMIDNLIAYSTIRVFYDYSLNKDQGNGYYDLYNKSIALRGGMSSLQTFKTLIHEIAHSLLHNDDKFLTRDAEVQAESIAYVVCSSLGLDTSEYSFEYVASWSEGKELKELRSSLTVIDMTSKQIIDWIEVCISMKNKAC